LEDDGDRGSSLIQTPEVKSKSTGDEGSPRLDKNSFR